MTFVNNSYPLAGTFLGQAWVDIKDNIVEAFYSYKRLVVGLHEHQTVNQFKDYLLSQGIPNPAFDEAIAAYESFQLFLNTIDSETPKGTHLEHISAIAGKPVYEETLDRTLQDTLSLIDNTVRQNGVLPQIDSLIELIKVALHYRAYQNVTKKDTIEDIEI
ncbi:MAG: hypothetical protein HC878_00240 [Leptolyngbyaceae cyanobacterium SL_5_14]|nr:hypothetical protein [Leptolyngbyaceae cyanobacterium SL_5_14]